MAVLRSDRQGERGRKPLIFLASFFHGTPCHQVLQFFVGTQAQHLLATAGRVPRAQILVHDIEELLELERCTPGKNRNQLLGHKIGNSTGECIFLENSHKDADDTMFRPKRSSFLRDSPLTRV